MALYRRTAISEQLWVVSVTCTLIVSCVGKSASAAQDPAVQGQGSTVSNGSGAAFHTSTREVLVDAAVVDKKGNFERGLTRQDFRLWEDGKEQKITSFSLELGSEGGVEHRNKHSIALVFETDWPGLRDEVTQFVERFASPGLQIAIFSRIEGEMLMQQPFTEDTERIKTVLRTMRVTIGKPMQGAGPNHQPFFERLNSVATALAPIRGRKVLILFSYGLFSQRNGSDFIDGKYRRPAATLGPGAAWLFRTIGICNAANVSVYSFAMGKDAGVSIDFYTRPENPANDQGGMTDFIRDLAVGTGGKYMAPGKYDLAAYLHEVSNDQSEYYLLGYESSARPSEDPCHTLKVKVARGGMRVNARDGYCSH